MTTVLRDEARSMLYDVASYAPPHLTIGGKILFVEREFKHKIKKWRVEAAWYGHAGSWSAAAIHDLRLTYTAWKEEKIARAKSMQETDRQRKMAADRRLLEESRAECVAALARIESRLALLTGDAS